MQPHVKHIDVYIRTPVWFVSIAGNDGNGTEVSTFNYASAPCERMLLISTKYTKEQREEFKADTKALVAHAKHLETEMNALWALFFKDSEGQKAAQELFRNRMSEFIKDKRLLKGITPKFSIGCRRITPGISTLPRYFIDLTKFR